MLDRQVSLSTRLAELWEDDADAAVFWTWLLPHLDDFGRQEADPAVLKAAVCPLVPRMDVDRVKEVLRKLLDLGLIEAYAVEGSGHFLSVPNFERFQTWGRGREARFPGPSGERETYARNRSTMGKDSGKPGRERTSAKGSRTPAPEGRKEGSNPSLPSTPSFPSADPPVGDGPAPETLVPEGATYADPGRRIKLDLERTIGTTYQRGFIVIGKRGGYLLPGKGIYEFDVDGAPLHVWQPGQKENARIEWK